MNYIDNTRTLKYLAKVISHEPIGDYHVHEGFLFKGHLVCITSGFINAQIMHNIHFGKIYAHIGGTRLSFCWKKDSSGLISNKMSLSLLEDGICQTMIYIFFTYSKGHLRRYINEFYP